MSMTDPEAVWTKMIFADDWLFPNCLERMVEAGEARASIGIVSSYRLDDRSVNCDGLPFPSRFVPGRDIARASLVDNLYVAGSPSTLLYRSDVVRARQPFYPSGAWHEDTEIFLEILKEHDFGFVHEVLSFTRRENESLTTALRQYDPEHRLDKLIVTMKFGPVFLDEVEFRACRNREMKAYYDYLGRRCLYSTADGFWEHQHAGLERAGLGLQRGRFIRHWLAAFVRQLASPGHVLARLKNRLPDNTAPSSTAREKAGEH
ncbi:hypothetical protein DRQ32_12350 [bacterium]|nr:MAG: hypothetical protein DRQ32_12350 [bacterium]